jgi:hypothetical protein
MSALFMVKGIRSCVLSELRKKSCKALDTKEEILKLTQLAYIPFSM